ncbi:MAG: DNA-3-methyladenine glycosylase [Planctomycetes bacterium]|nr:DNA-3-methyladenine glycosylase [Planctomycetota bacterium]
MRTREASDSGLVTRPNRRFFATDAATLAKRLIGCRLVRVLSDGERLSGVIVETEAYLGVQDRASHAFGGRRTARNEAMYSPPGTSYVYFTYGMHFCMNVVCGAVDEPAAVLLRALEPSEGLARMRLFRATPSRPAPADTDLCSGPGNLCRALAIDRALNGVDLVESDQIWVERGGFGRLRLETSPRIGIPNAGEWVDKPLRWFVAGHPHVSAGAAARSGEQGVRKKPLQRRGGKSR